MKSNKLQKWIILAMIIWSCQSDKSHIKLTEGNEPQAIIYTDSTTKYTKPFISDLPTIGLLMYDGVLQSEVIATSDVFAKLTIEGKQLFNVITIAESDH